MFVCIIAYNGGENLCSIGKQSIELYHSNGKILGKKESGNMDLKRELTDYEIGGIGDIKNTPSGSIHTELEQRVGNR